VASVPSTPAGGPLASLRHLGATLVALAGARAELAVVELREEGERRKDQLVVALAAALFVLLALVCASLLVVVFFWDTHRIAALAAVTAAHAGLGAWAIATLRSMARSAPPPFEATLAELARDREMLGGADE
jgi:uncharacterized membrane protein YqjE